jgi:hypothetical protein
VADDQQRGVMKIIVCHSHHMVKLRHSAANKKGGTKVSPSCAIIEPGLASRQI